MTKFCLPLEDLALVVDRHHGQGHANRPGHVLEAVGGAGIGAAVIADLVATAEAVPHVDALHDMVEDDRAVRLDFVTRQNLTEVVVVSAVCVLSETVVRMRQRWTTVQRMRSPA